ncbi:double homeobox protein 4C-like [Pteropus vampyrus]|uniref:Double homeobox protein 4C-like n=1 Tax=Pteropus vampyrus TaxID=132908 RepID=A0A6P3RQW6_PTEVA|nr:double homeobox protein 4C-like [Pteropus vampyrus]
MATTGASTGTFPRGSRRRRIVLKPHQKEALYTLFQQNPYPGITTRTQLAQEIGLPESRIQVWFQNQRRRHLKQSRLRSTASLKERQCHSEEQPPSGAPVCIAKEARRKRTPISPSQRCVLIQAFEKNRFPSIVTREDLARRTGIPECRIQVWFQNRRARHPGQSTHGPLNALARGEIQRDREERDAETLIMS